jgi:hypothetical protein
MKSSMRLPCKSIISAICRTRLCSTAFCAAIFTSSISLSSPTILMSRCRSSACSCSTRACSRAASPVETAPMSSQPGVGERVAMPRLSASDASRLASVGVGLRFAACLRPLLSIDVVTVSTSPVFSACSRTLATCGWLAFTIFATWRFDFVGSAWSTLTISRSLSSTER